MREGQSNSGFFGLLVFACACLCVCVRVCVCARGVCVECEREIVIERQIVIELSVLQVSGSTTCMGLSFRK